MTFLDVVGLAGVAIILVWSPLFAWARKGFARPLLTCAMCTGFWVGLFGSIALERASGAPSFVVVYYLSRACAVSLVAHLFYLAARVLDCLWDRWDCHK